MLVSQAHHELSRFIPFGGYMEVEEFPAVSLLYFTSVAVAVHIIELSDVKGFQQHIF